MIKIENLTYYYSKENVILNDINLKINDGEFVAIVGKNGSGKSTLSKLISGLLKLRKGNIFIDDEEIRKIDIKKLRKKVGLILQNPENQIIFNNVYDDIEFALKNLEIGDREEKIKKSLKKVGMEGFINSETYTLSLGQKQRIAIAGALSVGAKYIIFDEPTTMIDSQGKEEIYKVLNELKTNGYTIIYITNNIDEILMADKTIILKEGKIEKEININELIDNIDIFKKCNLNVPKMLEIVNELEKNNIKINIQNWNIDELTQKIIKEIKK